MNYCLYNQGLLLVAEDYPKFTFGMVKGSESEIVCWNNGEEFSVVSGCLENMYEVLERAFLVTCPNSAP